MTASSTPTLSTRRYLVLWFPWLASERVHAQALPPESNPETDAGPFALVVRAGNACGWQPSALARQAWD